MEVHAGIPKLVIINDQAVCRIDGKKLTSVLSLVVEHIQRIDPGTSWEEITLVLVDNQGIISINSGYLHSNETTDVISFRYDSIPGVKQSNYGEIFVNAERALEAGPRYNGVSSELALYVAHGCDHLTGADDSTPHDYARMRRRELRWLREADRRGLLANLASPKPAILAKAPIAGSNGCAAFVGPPLAACRKAQRNRAQKRRHAASGGPT